MTTVTFEVGTIADAVREASAVAPTKGRDIAQLGGFYFEIRPDGTGGGSAFLRCTNHTVYYTKQVEVLKIDGINQDWRLPSIPLSGFLGSLAIGSGRQVTFERETVEDANSSTGYRYTNRIRMEAGRARASVILIPTEDYPDWEPFDSSELPLVHRLGERVDQVGWAASPDAGEPWTGVYMDGERLVSTDRYTIANTPCEVNLGDSDPVTVPLNLVGAVLKQIQDVRIGIFGNFLCIAPNDYTQIKVVLYADNLPDMSKFMNTEYDQCVMVQREALSAAISRVLSIGAADRQIAIHLTVGHGEISLYLEGEGQTETCEDAVILTGQADHEPVEYKFGPQRLLDCIAKAPSSEIMFHYDLDGKSKVVKFETSSGYAVWSVPRRGVTKKTDT